MDSPESRLKKISAVIVVVIAVNVFLFYGRSDSKDAPESMQSAAPDYISAPIRNPKDYSQAYILPVSEPSYIPILDSSIPRPSIDAKAAIIYDLRSARFLYQDNIRTALPIASLTKVMSAVIVSEKMNLNDVVKVTSSAIRADGSKQDLYEGEEILAGDLLKMMLISSSNDAAFALLEHAKQNGIDLVAEMNKKAVELEMNDTRFVDPAGLNDEGKSTVYDLIKMIKYTLNKNNLWSYLIEKEIEVKSVDGKITHRVKNTDELLGVTPNIIGGKTGYTDGALGCLILLVDIPEHSDTIISVVLGSRDRFGDTKRMIDWVKTAYRWE